MYELVIPPDSEPISLSDIKADLRIDHDQDDILISSLLITARTFLERRADIAFLPQTWRARGEASHRLIVLRPSRVSAILSVSYVSDEGTVVAPQSDWSLRRGRPDCLELHGIVPAGTKEITVEYDAGFTDSASVPADLLRALSLLTAHYYEERELFRAQRYVPVPLGIDAILQPYREVRL